MVRNIWHRHEKSIIWTSVGLVLYCLFQGADKGTQKAHSDHVHEGVIQCGHQKFKSEILVINSGQAIYRHAT